MQVLAENMTEILNQLLKGETGDASKQLTEAKARDKAASLWASISNLFRK